MAEFCRNVVLVISSVESSFTRTTLPPVVLWVLLTKVQPWIATLEERIAPIAAV